MASINLAWLAGFFDGEGCFMLGDITDYRTGNKYLQHPRAGITQKNQHQLLLEIQQKYGGNIQLRKDGVEHWYTNRVEQVIKLIEDILPYLRVKKEKAEIILAICRLCGSSNRDNQRIRAVLQEHYHQRFPKIRRTKDEKEAQDESIN